MSFNCLKYTSQDGCRTLQGNSYYRVFKPLDLSKVLDSHITTKSHYKFVCEGCGTMIHKGEDITLCAETRGMELRPRESVNGNFYTPCSGSRWIHTHCTITEYDPFFNLDITVWSNFNACLNAKLENSNDYLDYHSYEQDDDDYYSYID